MEGLEVSNSDSGYAGVEPIGGAGLRNDCACSNHAFIPDGHARRTVAHAPIHTPFPMVTGLAMFRPARRSFDPDSWVLVTSIIKVPAPTVSLVLAPKNVSGLTIADWWTECPNAAHALERNGRGNTRLLITDLCTSRMIGMRFVLIFPIIDSLSDRSPGVRARQRGKITSAAGFVLLRPARNSRLRRVTRMREGTAWMSPTQMVDAMTGPAAPSGVMSQMDRPRFTGKRTMLHMACAQSPLASVRKLPREACRD